MSDLTPELKQIIDSLSYQALLARWRFARIGHPLFQGESGEYITARMAELRNAEGGNEAHVKASKEIGWD